MVGLHLSLFSIVDLDSTATLGVSPTYSLWDTLNNPHCHPVNQANIRGAMGGRVTAASPTIADRKVALLIFSASRMGTSINSNFDRSAHGRIRIVTGGFAACHN